MFPRCRIFVKQILQTRVRQIIILVHVIFYMYTRQGLRESASTTTRISISLNKFQPLVINIILEQMKNRSFLNKYEEHMH